ncbi:hypothetical protein CCY99_03325 [Helicobacter sp. 16-1353]|uniref:hypothetical protein n=1 Tax=Helicobacter sp. 16-1353 TaxID=2004996 RepID=UPI000DCCD7B9|nr:hypothetical protein [Helicobacter sp. 16-1353]RAX54397.1 hypothetical protein CCY99_03325 [Helicobacter sp. 16-1353]
MAKNVDFKAESKNLDSSNIANLSVESSNFISLDSIDSSEFPMVVVKETLLCSFSQGEATESFIGNFANASFTKQGRIAPYCKDEIC